MNIKSLLDKLKERQTQADNTHSISKNYDNDPDLDRFMNDVYKTYIVMGKGTYVSLDLLKKKLLHKYSQDKFEELLILARQKYPASIRIERNARAEIIVKFTL